MPRIEVFSQCRLKNFAGLVSRELGVQVRLRGKEICVQYGPPPVIYLPNMEFARDEDLLPIYGFCLHEAGHICYTDFKVGAQSPDYLVKLMHNAIEDEYMERMLERDFPGAREMLTRSYLDGIKAVFGEKTMIEPVSFLAPEKKGEVIEHMKSIGLDATDESLISDVAKRLEIIRAAKLWIIEKRRYPLPLHDWQTHPWREVFERETNPPARKSKQAYEQALRIIERLGVQPCLPCDKRPVEEAKVKIAEAKRCRHEAREAKRTLTELRREKNAEVQRLCERTPEYLKLLEARDRTRAASERFEEVVKANERLSDAAKIAEEAEAECRKRLDEREKRLEELKAALENADATSKEELERKVERLSNTVERSRAALARRQKKLEELGRQRDAVAKDADKADAAHEAAQDAEAEAQREFSKRAAEIRREIAERFRERIDRALGEAKDKLSAAKSAIDEANKILSEIKKCDSEIEEHVGPGAAEKVINDAFKRFRSEGIEQEITALGFHKANPADQEAGVETVKAAFPSPIRKYCPFDRSHDRVDRIAETPDGCVKFEQARTEYAKIIQETTERLRRLYSPTKNKLKVNVERGRLDPRKAYKIGLGLRGVPVDLSRVWRTIDDAKDPKVAVSLLIDCSGSMRSAGAGGERSIILAQKAAAALSQVLRNLGIPHEIVGHTTWREKAEEMLKNDEFTLEDTANFSRITPFRGYVFKAFEEMKAPASVFSDVEMQDNLDGEAVLWAVQRLAARPERTKICISICDGMPAASYSNLAELERHLYLTCKQIEAREKEGLFLFGLGIGVERVRKFYKNSDVITSVTDLPKAVLGIVEHVLSKLIGTLG